jgi:hypothetical protein
LDVREIKDGQQPTPGGDDYLLSKARANDSIMPTLIWEPAHPPPKIVCIAAPYPTIVSFIQLEGATEFTLVYLNIF